MASTLRARALPVASAGCTIVLAVLVVVGAADAIAVLVDARAYPIGSVIGGGSYASAESLAARDAAVAGLGGLGLAVPRVLHLSIERRLLVQVTALVLVRCSNWVIQGLA